MWNIFFNEQLLFFEQKLKKRNGFLTCLAHILGFFTIGWKLLQNILQKIYENILQKFSCKLYVFNHHLPLLQIKMLIFLLKMWIINEHTPYNAFHNSMKCLIKNNSNKIEV
jgi:hypothetical protein